MNSYYSQYVLVCTINISRYNCFERCFICFNFRLLMHGDFKYLYWKEYIPLFCYENKMSSGHSKIFIQIRYDISSFYSQRSILINFVEFFPIWESTVPWDVCIYIGLPWLLQNASQICRCGSMMPDRMRNCHCHSWYYNVKLVANGIRSRGIKRNKNKVNIRHELNIYVSHMYKWDKAWHIYEVNTIEYQIE